MALQCIYRHSIALFLIRRISFFFVQPMQTLHTQSSTTTTRYTLLPTEEIRFLFIVTSFSSRINAHKWQINALTAHFNTYGEQHRKKRAAPEFFILKWKNFAFRNKEATFTVLNLFCFPLRSFIVCLFSFFAVLFFSLFYLDFFSLAECKIVRKRAHRQVML